jgi:hypothetical protein
MKNIFINILYNLSNLSDNFANSYKKSVVLKYEYILILLLSFNLIQHLYFDFSYIYNIHAITNFGIYVIFIICYMEIYNKLHENASSLALMSIEVNILKTYRLIGLQSAIIARDNYKTVEKLQEHVIELDTHVHSLINKLIQTVEKSVLNNKETLDVQKKILSKQKDLLELQIDFIEHDDEDCYKKEVNNQVNNQVNNELNINEVLFIVPGNILEEYPCKMEKKYLLPDIHNTMNGFYSFPEMFFRASKPRLSKESDSDKDFALQCEKCNISDIINTHGSSRLIYIGYLGLFLDKSPLLFKELMLLYHSSVLESIKLICYGEINGILIFNIKMLLALQMLKQPQARYTGYSFDINFENLLVEEKLLSELGLYNPNVFLENNLHDLYIIADMCLIYRILISDYNDIYRIAGSEEGLKWCASAFQLILSSECLGLLYFSNPQLSDKYSCIQAYSIMFMHEIDGCKRITVGFVKYMAGSFTTVNACVYTEVNRFNFVYADIYKEFIRFIMADKANAQPPFYDMYNSGVISRDRNSCVKGGYSFDVAEC